MDYVNEKRWRIREYEAGDEERIVPFFNAVFGGSWEGFEPRTIELWKWQFERNPLGHHTFVAEDGDGKLIGNYAGIRVPFVHEGGALEGAQIVDTCVAAAYRGSGLFVELARAFFDRFGNPGEDSIMFGYPNPPALRVGTRHLGYVPIHCPIAKLVCDIDEGWTSRASARASGVRWMELDTLDERAESLWGRIREGYALGTRRDRRYLHWRYELHPQIRYRFVAALDASGDIVGLLVLRLGWFLDRVVPLVDWLAPRGDGRILAALLSGAAAIALEGGMTRLETWFPPRCPERDLLADLGFADRETTFNLIIRVFDPSLSVEWARENWFYTMGDADFY